MTRYVCQIAALAACVLPGILAAGPAAAQAKGDAKKGQSVFNLQCKFCHSVAEGQNGQGPSLGGIFGRKAGTEAGFAYSDAMKTSGLVWNADTLSRYLTAPQKLVPGTKMQFTGLNNPQQLRDLLTYLQTATQ